MATKRKPVYLAGPFFNPAQVALMESIEAKLTELEVEFFSPRLHTHAPVGSARQELGAWDEVLTANVEAMEGASLLLAVLDYKLPNGTSLTLNQHTDDYEGNHGEPIVLRKPMAIPDTGTVWELGFAFAEQIPAVGFFEHRPERLNLMLTNTLDALLIGQVALEHFFHLALPQGNPWKAALARLMPQLGDWNWAATTSLESYLAEGGKVI